jgi:hypothetical protein
MVPQGALVSPASWNEQTGLFEKRARRQVICGYYSY